MASVPLFETPWTTACQVSLSITNSWSLLKFTSIESVMPLGHGHSVAVHTQDFLKKVAIIRDGTQPHPSTEDWIKDLLSMALPIRTRPSFPYSQSLPSGSFDKPLT